MKIYKEHWELRIKPCGEDSVVVIAKDRNLLEDELVKYAKNKWESIPRVIATEKHLRDYLGEDTQNDYMAWEFSLVKRLVSEL